MATYLKKRSGVIDTREYDTTIRKTVEDILWDIETRGDASVQELSEKFDE